jgi:biotin synthase
MPQPPIETYRRVQLARHLIVHGKTRFENMKFNNEEQITDFGTPQTTLHQIIQEGTAFCTSGCPECNRPYYNERPSGPIYNYPRQPTADEINQIKKQLET